MPWDAPSSRFRMSLEVTRLSTPLVGRATRGAAIALCLLALSSTHALAQGASPALPEDSVIVRADWNVEQPQPFRPTLSLSLSRPLQTADGRLAVVVGHRDLSALIVQRGRQLLLPLRREALDDAAFDVAVYLVQADGRWHPKGSFPVRRRTRLGLDSTALQPRLEGQSEGQLHQNGTDAALGGRGLPFQDVAWNGGFAGTLHRGAFRAGWESMIVANARQPLRLRAGSLGEKAPAIDLASYQLRVARRSLTLEAGHVQVGTDRLLASQFRSRGVVTRAALGRVGSVSVGSVAGSELVGWEDPVGLARPTHRVQLANVQLEAVPSRPGVLHAEFTAMDGSLQPLPGFAQSAVTDREQSRGFGGSISAALPSQRARLALGMAQSRFTNPVDRLLSGDSPIVPVASETRWARFADLSVDVLRQRKLAGVTSSLQLAARHQHTDPLYRSVATFVQADRREDALEATGALGAVQWQGSVAEGRDNLANVRTLLTTRTRTRTASTSLPVALLVRRPDAWWLPTLSASWQGNGQRGDVPPDSAGFRDPAQRPDQWSTNGTVSAAWQRSILNVALRVNRSFVDNRQLRREASDFRTLVQALTLGVNPHPTLSLNADMSSERQEALEPSTRSLAQRVALQVDWRPWPTTALNAAWSSMRTDDQAATQRGLNDEWRAELSQGLTWRRIGTGRSARAFMRFARTAASTRFGGTLERVPPQQNWSAGVSARFF
jgi:hypothetical protein